MRIPEHPWAPVLLLIAACCLSAADPPATDPAAPKLSAEEARAASLEALEQFNALVGEWRGVGQPVRNSNKGAWSEAGAWVWEIGKDRVAVRFDVTDGKLLDSGLLTYDPEGKRFRFRATLPDDKTREYTGAVSGKKLTLESQPDDGGEVHQIVVTQLNEKRTLVLYQVRRGKQQQFARVAEVGYTRAGTRIAEEGIDGPECIVTGGKGTMSTVYQGKTYWFCCTGCRDAFNDDPDAIIAQAAKRAARKKAAAEEAAKKPKA